MIGLARIGGGISVAGWRAAAYRMVAAGVLRGVKGHWRDRLGGPLHVKVLGALAVLGLLAAACAADVILFFMRAGEVLGGLELLAIVLLGAAALALTALRPRYWLCALPIVAFVVFRTGVVDLVPVPRDAVLRDAQAGLSVVVVVGAQMLLVPLGLGLASLIGNPPRTGI